MKTVIIKAKEGCTECKECPLDSLPTSECRNILIRLGLDCEEYDLTNATFDVVED